MSRKLPIGKYTDNDEEYIAEWQKIAKRLETILDCRVIGFDPSFLVESDEGKAFNLPLWAAEKIIESKEMSQPDVGIIIRMNSEYNKVYRHTGNAGDAMRAAIGEWIEAKPEGEA